MMSALLTKTVRLSTILGGDTRLEASTYLRDGYGFVRLANQCSNHMRLGDLADIWQPSRLAGYTVPEGKGLPFFTAGQVFEDFPRVRKWLAAPFVPQADSRRVEQSWLLLSCSGVVGNVTAVYPHHINKIITHDLLRIVPKSTGEYGWLYAYMSTEFFKQMAQAAQYGHMIKHIEVEHANEFPVIMPEKSVRDAIGEMATRAVGLRTQSRELRDESFLLLEQFMDNRRDDSVQPLDSKQSIISLSTILQNRLRLDADSYAGQINAIDGMVANGRSDTIGSLTTFCSDLGRFARIYGNGGRPYVSASELFDVNAKSTKMIYAKLVKDWEKYILHPGTIIMACSGQKYGILGRALMLTANHEGLFGSHDLMRIIPDEGKIRPGYLLAFLNDPLMGRPYVVRNAYGTSIPHLDAADIRGVRIPRFDKTDENAIADLMDESVSMSAEADRLENEATRLAQEQIDLAISQM
jgi:hypothetical protein